MRRELAGKRAILTGASGGIGRATADALVKAGVRAALHNQWSQVPASGTVEDLAEKVHKDLAASLTHARIWGSGVHDGQSVGRDHVLADKDLVELHG